MLAFFAHFMLASAPAPTINIMTPADFLRDTKLKHGVSPNPIFVNSNDVKFGEKMTQGRQRDFNILFRDPTFTIFDSPPIIFRGENEGIQKYYQETLCQEGETAVIVPYEHLERMKSALPDLEVRYYESSRDFFTLQWLAPGSRKVAAKARKTYDRVVDLARDSKFLELTMPTMLGKKVKVDCIIHTRPYTMENLILPELAKHMWVGTKGNEDFWESLGTRTENKLEDPHTLICDFRPISYRFPIFDKSDMKPLFTHAQQALKIFKYLEETCDGCGWFTGVPRASILACPPSESPRNVLADPGTEHLHILPLDEDQLIEWLDDGSVEKGRVVLIDTKGNKYASFKPQYRIKSGDWEDTAEVVVFFCNHASTSSPEFAEYFHKLIYDKTPESRLRIMVLRQGMGGLLRRLIELGRDEDFLNLSLQIREEKEMREKNKRQHNQKKEK